MNLYFRLAIRNLRRNFRRSLATGIAIAFGYAGLLLLGGYAFRVWSYLTVYSIYGSRTGHLVVYAKDGLEKYTIKPKLFSLTIEDQGKINKVLSSDSNVDFYSRELDGSGLIGNGCSTLPFIAKGIESDSAKRLIVHPDVVKWNKPLTQFQKGKGFWEYDQSLAPVQISLGLVKLLMKPNVHDDFVGKPPSGIVMVDCTDSAKSKTQFAADANVQLVGGAWSGSMSALDGEIVAQYTTGIADADNSALLAPMSLLQKLYDTDNVMRYTVFIKNETLLDQTIARLGAEFEMAGVKADLYPWHDVRINPMYKGTIDFIKTLVGFISFVLLIVVIFSIFNSATMTVIERSQEIGMFRSIGYTRRLIHRLFAIEIFVLAFAAVVGGGVVAIATMLSVNAANIRYYPPGVAGGLQLLLIPNTQITIVAAVIVMILAIAATLAAVRLISNKGIPNLISGAHR